LHLHWRRRGGGPPPPTPLQSTASYSLVNTIYQEATPSSIILHIKKLQNYKFYNISTLKSDKPVKSTSTFSTTSLLHFNIKHNIIATETCVHFK
jgi:hypothetical protein